MRIMGINSSIVYDDAEFEPGTLAFGDAGKGYVFIKAGGAIAVGNAVIVDEGGGGNAITVVLAGTGFGDRVGAAMSALTSGKYGWVQVYGPGSIKVKASAAANVLLYVDSAGTLDDDGATGEEQIDGVALTTARAATDGVAPCVLNFPVIGATKA